MFWLVWTFVSTKFLNLITNKSNIRRIFFICAYRKHCFGFRPVHFCTTLTSNYWIHTSYCGTKKRNSRTYCFIKNLICWPQSKTEAQLVLPPFHFHLHAIKGWLMPLRFSIQDRNLAPPNQDCLPDLPGEAVPGPGRHLCLEFWLYTIVFTGLMFQNKGWLVSWPVSFQAL